MRTKPLVTVVMVSWNGLQWLQLSLPTLMKQSYKNLHIIVVDNNSTDESIVWIKKSFPKIQIIPVKVNTGYAQANNIGYEQAKGEYIYFLNNDVKLTPTCIEEMVRVLESDTSLGGVQSKIRLLSDSKRLDTIGAFLTPTGFLYHYAFMNIDMPRLDKQIDIFTAKGASMMFTRKALQAILVDGELFDSNSFAYFEETDMCHRIWLSGKRIAYAPKAVLYHQMGGTSTTMNQAFIQYHSFKNRIGSYIKNMSLGTLCRILPVHLISIQIFALVALCKGKIFISWSIEKAILWNLFHLPQLLSKRAIIQSKIRQVKDSDFLSEVLKSPPLNYYKSQMLGLPYLEQP